MSLPAPGDLLDIVPEPSLLVGPDRAVLAENRLARGLFGASAVGRPLPDLLADDPQAVDRLMRRALGAGSPSLGALHARASGGVVRRKVWCRRIAAGPGDAVVAVRFEAEGDGRFLSLTRKIDELNAEIRERLRIQSELEESLERNRLLLRELQHRVNNTIQMLIALVRRQGGAARSPEFETAARQLTQRLMAIGKSHEFMYRSGEFQEVPAEPFLVSLVEMLRTWFGADVAIDLDVRDEFRFTPEGANAVALIVNELVTNAFKHGLRGGTGRIGVTLERIDDGWRLAVRDDGGGMTEPGMGAADAVGAPAGFGLALVRGLCRQLGGQLSVASAGGAVFAVTVRGVQAENALYAHASS
jgi:two-component sensor histidine kinase